MIYEPAGAEKGADGGVAGKQMPWSLFVAEI